MPGKRVMKLVVRENEKQHADIHPEDSVYEYRIDGEDESKTDYSDGQARKDKKKK
jgi:hypothetical protein